VSRAGGNTPALKVLPGTLGGSADHPREDLRLLYERYGASVYGRCQFILHDRVAAEDAMQEVFAKALVNFASFRAEASPLTWLLKIATNHCLNLLRSARAPWHAQFEREARARTDQVPGPQAFEMRDLVGKMLSRVDAETQAAAIHYHVDEMSLEEVAELLGRSVPTIRKRLQEFSALCAKEFSS
jgi:RNA polymerase sigma-70 factor (ECF subfamily)